ncbi:MAG: hypothetical protein HQK58_03810 [Deltaproteobacteria bacterium]|nr:hypothetical protein [Deltaproteobacteria bacterium]
MVVPDKSIFRILAISFIILSLAGEILGMTLKITNIGPGNDDKGSITHLVQPGSTVYFNMFFSVTGTGNIDYLIKVSDAKGKEIPALESKGASPAKDGNWYFYSVVNLPLDLGPGKYTAVGSISSGGQELSSYKSEFFVQGGTDHIWINKMDVSATKDGPALSQFSPGAILFMRVHFSIKGATAGDKTQIMWWTVRPDGQYEATLAAAGTFDAADGSWVTYSQFTLPADAVTGVYTFWAVASVSNSTSGVNAGVGQFEIAGGAKKVTGISRPAPVTKSVPSPATGWSDLGLYGGQVYSIAIEPTKGNLVLAATYQGDGLFRSFDGGQTWQSVSGFRNKVVRSVAFFNQDPKTIWLISVIEAMQSKDGGRTFSSWTFGDLGPYSLCLHPTNPDVVYIGTLGAGGTYENGRVLMTTNGGKSWEILDEKFDYLVSSLVMNPQNPLEIWAGTGDMGFTGVNGSLYKSSNGGKTWSKVMIGFESSFDNLAIRLDKPQVIFAGGYSGLFRTKDGGTSWEKLAIPNYCRGLTLNPSNSDVVYIGGASTLYKSIDGGDNWNVIPTNDLSPLTLTCHPLYQDILYLGEYGQGIHISRDGGHTFSPSYEGIKANIVGFLSLDLTSAGDLLVANLSGLYRRGIDRSWKNLIRLGARYALQDPITPDILYVGATGDALYKTSDNGETWKMFRVTSINGETSSISSLALPTNGGKTLYAGTIFLSVDKGVVSTSTDSGETWRNIFITNRPVNTVQVSPDNPNLLLAGAGCFYAPNYPGNLYASPDRGRTWINLLKNVTVNRIDFSPDRPRRIFVSCGRADGTYSGLFISADLGNNWEQKKSGLPEYAAMVRCQTDPATGMIYLATYGHGVYFSQDAGQNWVSLGLEDYVLHDLVVSPAGVIKDGRRTTKTDSIGPPTIFAGGGSGISRKSGGGVGWVIGEVRDTNNQLLDNMIVETNGSMDYTVGGRFRLAVADGQYSIKCYGAGYQTTAFPNRVDVPTSDEVPLNFVLTPSKAAVAFRAVNDICSQKDTPEVTINYCGQGNGMEYLAVFPPDITGRFFCLDKQGNPLGDNVPSPRAKVTLTPDFNNGTDKFKLSFPGPGRYTLYTVIIPPEADITDFSTWLGYDKTVFNVD